MGTPIGNLSDLSDRCRQTIEFVDEIGAEDTRKTLKILKHFKLEKPLFRCDEIFQRRRPEILLKKLESGLNIALVTDAGTPGISDPGAFIVSEALKKGIKIVPIPGPSAITVALSICGFKAVPFTFYGFLPKKGGERQRILDAMIESSYTSCFFESPHRMIKTLTELCNRKPSRLVFVARELTKKFEQSYRGSLIEVIEILSQKTIKGECTIVIGPSE
ncbi:MAG: 16S rRNA (cytidine(1402)-2'-O)-methyltransferase [Bdellovibrionales bacterium]|nr:16S rRNA (cytidine(1402)-2'-O)-methyltransferase [Bdellovibrionales bacterium]